MDRSKAALFRAVCYCRRRSIQMRPLEGHWKLPEGCFCCYCRPFPVGKLDWPVIGSVSLFSWNSRLCSNSVLYSSILSIQPPTCLSWSTGFLLWGTKSWSWSLEWIYCFTFVFSDLYFKLPGDAVLRGPNLYRILVRIAALLLLFDVFRCVDSNSVEVRTVGLELSLLWLEYSHEIIGSPLSLWWYSASPSLPWRAPNHSTMPLSIDFQGLLERRQSFRCCYCLLGCCWYWFRYRCCYSCFASLEWVSQIIGSCCWSIDSSIRLAIKSRTRRASLCWALFSLYHPCRIRPLINTFHLLWVDLVPFAQCASLDGIHFQTQRGCSPLPVDLLASFWCPEGHLGFPWTILGL